MENRKSTFPLPGLSGLFDYQGEIHDLVRHRKLLNFSPWPFRSHPAKLKVTIKSWCQHIIPCPGDPMTVQMNIMKLKLKSFKSPKSSQLQRKSSQSVLEFHEKMRGFTDHARGGSIASGFGTWGSASAPDISGQHNAGSPNLFLKSKMSTPELLAKQGQRETSIQVNAMRLVSWIQSPGSTRETTLGEIPQKCAPWTPWTWSKRTKHVWCHFCIQCLNPFTLPLNLLSTPP